jgi:hypothetical protein
VLVYLLARARLGLHMASQVQQDGPAAELRGLSAAAKEGRARTDEGLAVDFEVGPDTAKRVKLTTEERRALLDNLDIEGTLLPHRPPPLTRP